MTSLWKSYYTQVVSINFFFSSRRRHTRWPRDWSSDVCSSDLIDVAGFLWKGDTLCLECTGAMFRKRWSTSKAAHWPIDDDVTTHDLIGQYARAHGVGIYAPHHFWTYDTEKMDSEVIPAPFEDAYVGEECDECNRYLV